MAHLKPECSVVQDIVSAQFERMDKVRILEAGCGSNSAFILQDNGYIVGLDLSERQLQQNETLDEKHLGDLQNYTFLPECFDMIICWNVLEHLSQPQEALENFEKWLSPGGIMILALPNLFSAVGLVTRFSPHWFHVWWYRKMYHIPNAGRDGRGPFKTFLKIDVSMPQLHLFGKRRGLTELFAKTYGARGRKRKGNLLIHFLRLLFVPIELITLRKVSAFDDAIMVVFAKDN